MSQVEKAALNTVLTVAVNTNKHGANAKQAGTPGAVERGGDKLIVPTSMELKVARDTIDHQITYESEEVNVHEVVDGFFWDAAHAVYIAMNEIFGWVFQKPTPGMFGPNPPALISIESGLDENGEVQTVSVPWGSFQLPGLEGALLKTAHQMGDDGLLKFVIGGKMLRKHEPKVKEIAALARRILAQRSLYKGKVVRVKWTDNDGDDNPMAMPHFVDTRKIDPASLILPEDLDYAVANNVFAPVRYTAAVRAANIPLKRGVLLSGTYGTGKTLTASVTAKYAEQNGWTFIYCERASELAKTIRFAMRYAPAVLFCEDVDREISGERSVTMDDILNVIDGIESKSSDLMIVLTSNHAENINQALLRPGRLDAVIEFRAPDAKAVERLVRHYAGDLLPAETDLSAVAAELNGRIPAVVRECVERAKLMSIWINQGEGEVRLTSDALIKAAKGMRGQLELLYKQNKPETAESRLFKAIGEAVAAGPMAEQMKDMHQRICE